MGQRASLGSCRSGARRSRPSSAWRVALWAALLGGCTSGSGNGSSTSSGPATGTGKVSAAPSGDPSGPGSDSVPDAKELASRLSATDAPSAEFVRAPEAQLTAYPTPFFTKGG